MQLSYGRGEDVDNEKVPRVTEPDSRMKIQNQVTAVFALNVLVTPGNVHLHARLRTALFVPLQQLQNLGAVSMIA